MVVVKKKGKNCAPCWKYLAGTPRRFCFISFKFSFLLFSPNFHSPTNPSVSPPTKSHCDVGLHVYGPSDDNLCCSSSKKKKTSQLVSSNSLKEEELFFCFLVSCFIFGICCKNIFILREEEEGELKKNKPNFGKGIKNNCFSSQVRKKLKMQLPICCVCWDPVPRFCSVAVDLFLFVPLS